jgi:hypothetical protein
LRKTFLVENLGAGEYSLSESILVESGVTCGKAIPRT